MGVSRPFLFIESADSMINYTFSYGEHSQLIVCVTDIHLSRISASPGNIEYRQLKYHQISTSMASE